MPDQDTFLTSTTDVVSTLGGTPAVQELTGAKTPQVVSNWVSRGRFAHGTFLQMTTALEAKGFSADPNLWGIEPVEAQEVETVS